MLIAWGFRALASSENTAENRPLHVGIRIPQQESAPKFVEAITVSILGATWW